MDIEVTELVDQSKGMYVVSLCNVVIVYEMYLQFISAYNHA